MSKNSNTPEHKKIKSKEFLKKAHKDTKKSKLSIYFDMKNCGKKYKSSKDDYANFEMYNMTEKERKTVLTSGINEELIQKCNSKSDSRIFTNKALFNAKFKKYIGRDWLILSEDNFNEFKSLCNKHSHITACKLGNLPNPLDNYKTRNNIKKLYTRFLEENKKFVESEYEQHSDIAKLNPKTFNYITIITLYDEIVVSYLRIGETLVAPINIETGIVDYPAVNNEGEIFERHPETMEQIFWYQVPKWPRIKRIVELAKKELPDVNYLSWNVCLGEKDPYIISITDHPESELYQLPAHRNNNIGLLPRFENILNNKGE